MGWLVRGSYRTGTVNVNTGAEGSDRWVSAGAAGVLTVGTAAPTAASSSIIWSDRVGREMTALAVRTTKTVHGANIAWTVRRAHGWCGAAEDWPVPALGLGISATAPAVGSGPMFMEAGGTGAQNLLNLPATAVFVDNLGVNTVGTTLILCGKSVEGTLSGLAGIVLEFHLQAGAITTTNTYTLETQWCYID